MSPREIAKFFAYRLPGINRLALPRYRYGLEPAQLAAMLSFIDATRGTDAAVVEAGVARGLTSVFILEHLRTTGDGRPLLIFDTFSGFTNDSIDWETQQRGKRRAEFDIFRYGSATRFAENLRQCGYENFKIHVGDAALFDWASIGRIGAMILDIDLYKPTKAVLELARPLLHPKGGIMIDDCKAGTPFDGSLQALTEMSEAEGFPLEIVGTRGGIVRAIGPAAGAFP